MKYFRLKENELCTLPILNKWQNVIEVKNICKKKKHLLPRRTLINIDINEKTFFPCVMLKPFILFSEDMYKVVKMYEPSMSGRQIILLNGESEISELYYIPIIERTNAIINNSNGKLRIKKDEMKYLNIFMEKDSNVPIINLDLAESILKRGMRGISLEPIELEII